MYTLTIAKGYNFLEVNNDNLITAAPVGQQLRSCFLTLERWEKGQA